MANRSMTREIVLLVLLSTGEIQETTFQWEWPCVQAAAAHNERGEQAWCVIEMPEERVPLEKYPVTPWSKDMDERLKAMQ